MKEQMMSLDTADVKCRARTANYGDPIDCEWPFCGCDDRAGKVVQCLQECGWEDGHPLHSRIAELEALLARSHGFVLEGAATVFARDAHLREIERALGWKSVADVAANVERLKTWANT